MNPSSFPDSQLPLAADLHEMIRRRAEQIYFESGEIPGRDLDNWSRAEREIMAGGTAAPRSSIVVRVNGVKYIGEYNPELSDGYMPGEFGTGAAIPIRFVGDKMFVRRPNGKELETTIVQKIG